MKYLSAASAHKIMTPTAALCETGLYATDLEHRGTSMR